MLLPVFRCAFGNTHPGSRFQVNRLSALAIWKNLDNFHSIERIYLVSQFGQNNFNLKLKYLKKVILKRNESIKMRRAEFSVRYSSPLASQCRFTLSVHLKRKIPRTLLNLHIHSEGDRAESDDFIARVSHSYISLAANPRHCVVPMSAFVGDEEESEAE